MADLRRSTPEPPPRAPQVRASPGLTDELLAELAPLLAEEGVDVDHLESVDRDRLQRALQSAVARRNLALFTPVGPQREIAADMLAEVARAILEGDSVLAAELLDTVQPESADGSVATVAGVIGTALGLLDDWLSGRSQTAPQGLGSRACLPQGHWTGERAAGDILALARKGRAFDSVGALIIRQGSHQVLPGSALAVAAVIDAWANATGEIHDDLLLTHIQ